MSELTVIFFKKNYNIYIYMSGITWTSRTSAADNQWRSVTYGNGLFVAVSDSGTGNRVMTSPDGITWTSRTSAADNQWWSVTYSDFIFVAVSISGTGDRVMTSGEITCVLGSTKIIMKDGKLKEIKDIKRGDEVIEDIKTNKINKVSRVISNNISNKYITKIPKNLLGNDEDLFITDPHPIWINDDKNRILSKNVEGVEKFYVESDIIYSLQYDTEGTFYANRLKIDSLSPYHKYYSLPKDLFIDKNKYVEGIKIMNEDDKIRNKPKMIENYINISIKK